MATSGDFVTKLRRLIRTHVRHVHWYRLHDRRSTDTVPTAPGMKVFERSQTALHNEYTVCHKQLQQPSMKAEFAWTGLVTHVKAEGREDRHMSHKQANCCCRSLRDRRPDAGALLRAATFIREVVGDPGHELRPTAAGELSRLGRIVTLPAHSALPIGRAGRSTSSMPASLSADSSPAAALALPTRASSNTVGGMQAPEMRERCSIASMTVMLGAATAPCTPGGAVVTVRHVAAADAAPGTAQKPAAAAFAAAFVAARFITRFARLSSACTSP
eukprot:360121-Chlamydomonas_euryale.AAC.2